MGKLQYSQELIADVKRLYPDQPTMHKLAEEGGIFLGRYIDDSLGSVPIDAILTAISLEEIQGKARLQKEKIALYRRWGNEYDQWRKDQP